MRAIILHGITTQAPNDSDSINKSRIVRPMVTPQGASRSGGGDEVAVPSEADVSIHYFHMA